MIKKNIFEIGFHSLWKYIIIVISISLCSCTSGATGPQSLLADPTTQYYGIRFSDFSFSPAVLTVTSKINADNSENVTQNFKSKFYNFQSSLKSNKDSCVKNICWSLWFIDESLSEPVDIKVFNNMNENISNILMELNHTFEDVPVHIGIYSIPPHMSFEDSYSLNTNEKSSVFDIRIAIHNKYTIPENDRHYRLYLQQYANSISMVVHELYHVLSLASLNYKSPYSLGSLFHNEVMGKCWQYQSYLNTISDEKAYLLLSEVPYNIMNEVYGELVKSNSTIYSESFLYYLIKNTLTLSSSPSVLGGQIIIYGRQKNEINAINEICAQLIEKKPEELIEEYHLLINTKGN